MPENQSPDYGCSNDMMNLETAKEQLAKVEAAILKLEGGNSYTDQVGKHFHLGMVGGSGRNVARLNRIRAKEIDRTIDKAVKLVPLYERRKNLKKLIEDIESGEYEKREIGAYERKKMSLVVKVTYWKSLKVGDEITLWTGNKAILTKVNKKSVFTDKAKWTAEEIIGKEAAALL